MKDVSHRESFAFSARVLGALFYFAPDSEQAAPLVKALTAGEWVQDWPLPETLQPLPIRLPHLPMSRWRTPGNGCLLVRMPCPLRRGVPSGWTVNPCCLATRPRAAPVDA
jgi:hypothetical protein